MLRVNAESPKLMNDNFSESPSPRQCKGGSSEQSRVDKGGQAEKIEAVPVQAL
jgi:hypothetical protein